MKAMRNDPTRIEYIAMETTACPIILHEDVKVKWLEVWEKLDIYSEGKISLRQLESFLLHSTFADDLKPEAVTTLLSKADFNQDGFLSKAEFIQLVKDSRQSPILTRILRSGAFLTLPRSSRNLNTRRYIEEYSCFPPPIFILTITIVEVCSFIYYGHQMNEPITPRGPAPLDSPLIYNPYKRVEAWRFLTYMFIHSGWLHLLTNIIVQLILGIILEMVHKWWRIMVIYLGGVFAGCLAASITYPSYYLAGASGGVYSLQFAYVGNVILNWSEMSYPAIQISFFAIISFMDVSFAIWDTFWNSSASNTSYVSHLGGALAGLLLGVSLLRNFKQRRWEKYLGLLSIVIYSALVVTGIGFHIGNPSYFPQPKN